MIRSFIALPLPDQTRAALEDIASVVPVGQRVPADNFHLTLAFLGDQSEADLRYLHRELATIITAPITLRIGGMDVFGGKTPRVLFLRADGRAALQALYRKVIATLDHCGIRYDRKRFQPHVTLARFNRNIRIEEVAKLGEFLSAASMINLAEAQIDTFSLYQSELHPHGPVYSELASYPLQTT